MTDAQSRQKPLAASMFSVDHDALLDTLTRNPKPLIIQDLDGVCMGLVNDPLTRTLDRAYIKAAKMLHGHFHVLTNGEHIGRRGVNGIVERTLASPELARTQGLYLPGLAAGGVQMQDCFGTVSHPGVSDPELAFLQAIPESATRFLADRLIHPLFALDATEIDRLVEASVLDNLASPTININNLFRRLSGHPDTYRQLQNEVSDFMDRLLADANDQGLTDAFFVHYAPNLGPDGSGGERLKYGDEINGGTTDFQFMLRGAIKEAGVLVILNHYYFHHTGHYPLGEDFNVREAPLSLQALLELAQSRFDPLLMPRIMAVGDTVSSHPHSVDGRITHLRGGSDRGFLTLVQSLGRLFGRDNIVAYVDSSRGEIHRPSTDPVLLQRRMHEPTLPPWPAIEGISDPNDPLQINVVFPDGHTQYVRFFSKLANCLQERDTC